MSFESMRQVLAAHIVREEPEHHFALIEFGNGSADVYLGASTGSADRNAERGR